MPDLTYEVYFHCSYAESWSCKVRGSSGDEYTIRFDNISHKFGAEHGYDYSCTCKAYQYHDGHCKHIKRVIASGQHCKWMQFTDGGEPVKKADGYHCPKCGSMAVALRWAV